jgi:hypothetical protein
MTRSRDVADTQDNLGGAVAPFVAGKNKIINGDFGIWQRGTSFTGTGGAYTSDRWVNDYFDGSPSFTVSRQTFTPGTAPVAGYEGSFFLRQSISSTGGANIINLTQKIEDARTLAGQTVTLSFWAKTDSARALSLVAFQGMGTGGTGGTTNVQTVFPNTSWTRFSWTFAIGSLTGATFGTNSYVQITFRQAIAAGSVLDIWGVQLEAGSVATPFTTASGSIGGELALCQRYYEKSYTYANLPGSTTSQQGLVSYQAVTSTAINNRCWVPFVVSKRTDSPTITIYNYNNGASGTALNESTGIYAVAIQFQSNRGFNLYPTNGTFAAGQVCNFYYTADSEL